MTRAGRLSITLVGLAFAGAAVAPASADIVVDVPGVTTVTVPVPAASTPPGPHGLKVHVPTVEVTLPRNGSRPPANVGPGNGGPTPTPPVTTTPTPDPPAADPTPRTATTATTTTTPAPAPGPQPPTPATTHTPAAKSAPAAQSHTVAAITRSGSSAPPRRQAAVTPHAAPKATFVADATPAPPTRHATKRASHRPVAEAKPPQPRRPRTIGTVVGDVVDGLPSWVLGIFVGFAALAVAMAIDAYVSSRRARRLAVQRAALVDDVGHLQAALLAPVPATPAHVSFSVAYRPAAGLAAGGDFYDVFELDDDRIAMLLGDVSGHGRESVAHAALVRFTVRTFIAAGHGPAEAIALTDPCLDGHMDDQFATVVAAIYDHATHTLTYAKAGHYPPVALGVDDDGSVASSSPPIGAGLNAVPTDVTVDIEPGATVCFFTDGLVEARRAGIPLGPERVERLLADAPDDAEALIAAVVAEADALNDDVAVCVLHRPADAVEPSFDLVGSTSAGGGIRTPTACATGT